MICHIIMKEHHSFRTLHHAECNNEWAWLSKSDGKWMKISKEFCGNACYFVCGNQRAMQEYKHTYFPYGLPVNWIQLLSLALQSDRPTSVAVRKKSTFVSLKWKMIQENTTCYFNWMLKHVSFGNMISAWMDWVMRAYDLYFFAKVFLMYTGRNWLVLFLFE